MNKKKLLEIKNLTAKSFSKEILENNTQAAHKVKEMKNVRVMSSSVSQHVTNSAFQREERKSEEEITKEM